jgi:acetyl esterase/lipase
LIVGLRAGTADGSAKAQDFNGSATRFPGAFEDALAAVRDVFERIAELGGDNMRVGVAGDSAGGNLAAAVAIACRDAGIDLAAQLLVYPVTNATGNYADPRENARFPSRTENAEGYFLSRAGQKRASSGGRASGPQGIVTPAR